MPTTLLNSKSTDTKVLVFRLLIKNSPLNITQIQTALRTQYKRKITYQAVRKIVRKFSTEKILDKNDLGYSLNRHWLLNAKEQIDLALNNQDSQTFSSDPITKVESENYSSYLFSSLYDLDTFWGMLALDLTASWKGPKPVYYSVTHYAWWIIFNLGRELAFWKSIKDRGFHPEIHLLRNVPLNKWAADTYEDLGITTRVTKDRLLDQRYVYNFIGDTTFRVTLTPSCLNEIKLIFETKKSLDQLSPKILNSLAHKRHQVELTVFNDPIISKGLRDVYLK